VELQAARKVKVTISGADEMALLLPHAHKQRLLHTPPQGLHTDLHYAADVSHSGCRLLSQLRRRREKMKPLHHRVAHAARGGRGIGRGTALLLAQMDTDPSREPLRFLRSWASGQHPPSECRSLATTQVGVTGDAAHPGALAQANPFCHGKASGNFVIYSANRP
jgi:hypothetical protein